MPVWKDGEGKHPFTVQPVRWGICVGDSKWEYVVGLIERPIGDLTRTIVVVGYRNIGTSGRFSPSFSPVAEYVGSLLETTHKHGGVPATEGETRWYLGHEPLFKSMSDYERHRAAQAEQALRREVREPETHVPDAIGVYVV